MNRWTSASGDFDEFVGYSFLGDVFLRNSKSGQFAILFTINPELVALDFHSFADFKDGFLSNKKVECSVFQKKKLDEINNILGNVSDGETYIPVPYPFLGGDCSIGSYKKGKLFTFLDLVGGMQGVE